MKMRQYIIIFLFTISLLAFETKNNKACAEENKLPNGIAYITNKEGRKIKFDIEIAKTEDEKANGLMFRKKMAKNSGMLFLFDEPEIIKMWMKNTYIALDMLFIDDKGHVVKIAHNTTPMSTKVISSEVRIVAVLEINAMLSDQLSIKEGDLFVYQ